MTAAVRRIAVACALILAAAAVHAAPALAYGCGVTLAHVGGEVLFEALAPQAPVVQRGR